VLDHRGRYLVHYLKPRKGTEKKRIGGRDLLGEAERSRIVFEEFDCAV